MRRTLILEYPEPPSWVGWDEDGTPTCNLEAPEVTGNAVFGGKGGHQHCSSAYEDKLDLLLGLGWRSCIEFFLRRAGPEIVASHPPQPSS